MKIPKWIFLVLSLALVGCAGLPPLASPANSKQAVFTVELANNNQEFGAWEDIPFAGSFEAKEVKALGDFRIWQTSKGNFFLGLLGAQETDGNAFQELDGSWMFVWKGANYGPYKVRTGDIWEVTVQGVTEPIFFRWTGTNWQVALK